jgi:hypothetical protein
MYENSMEMKPNTRFVGSPVTLLESPPRIA